MGVGDEERRDDVFFLCRHRRQTFAAAPLLAEIGECRAFDVAARGDGHDHVFALDQVFVVHIGGPVDDFGPARHGELVFHLVQFIADDLHDPVARPQNFKIVANFARQFLQLVRNFLDADLGQTLQAQFKDRAGLRLGQIVGAILVCGMGRIVNQRDVFKNIGRGPAAGHQRFACLGGVGGFSNGGNDFVDVCHSDGQTAEDVRPLACLAQLERGAAGNDIFAEIDKGGQETAQGQRFGATAVQRQHVAGKVRLHGREAEQLVQHDLGGGIALEFDDDAHAVAVGFVLHVGDAFDPLFAGGLCDAVDHRGLVDLIGHVVDDDGPAVFTDFLGMGAGPHDDRAATFEVGLARAGAAKNDAARREIRGGNIFDQLFGRQVGVVDQGKSGVDDLAQIVGRDVGGHTDGDAAGAVDQHVRKACGQDGRFLVLAVVVQLKVDRVLVDVAQQVFGDLFHAHFGIAVGRSLVAVHRAEVALTIQQNQ